MSQRSHEIHLKFFPQAKPICKYTIEQIREASDAARAKARELIFQKQRRKDDKLSSQRSRRANIHIIDDSPIHIEAPPRDLKILRVAALMYGVSMREMVGTKRTKYMTHARRYAATRLRDELGRSFPQIGGLLNRDQTTIQNLLNPKARRVKEEIAHE
tara:strand:- start:2227 stop:2700 length:474 start_codon:yes stop_codon:yes gene_type:complete